MFGDSSVIHVEQEECPDLTTIFHMAMIFGWDIDCFCKATFLQFEINHDGIIAFYFAEDDPGFGEVFFNATRRRLERYI